jgi:hypothetical protein
MLPDGKDSEARLVGELGGGENLLEALLGTDAPSVRPMRRLLPDPCAYEVGLRSIA